MTIETISLEEAIAAGNKRALEGSFSEAITFFQMALDEDPFNHQAITGLAYSQLPGDSYIENLKKFHTALTPRTYVEIGVETGASLALAQPPTLAIGIDPEPAITHGFTTKTRVFPLTSDAFFKQHHLPKIMEHEVVDMAFIDGMHLFENTLKDFMNLEKFSGPDTIILLHDCYPINALTAARKRQTLVWSGDPWKAFVCLKKYRPDLQCHTIATGPTGLGVIKGLNPHNTVLADNWDEIINEYTTAPYSTIANNKDEALSLLENDWPTIAGTFGIKNPQV